jgi:hypothetical protein
MIFLIDYDRRWGTIRRFESFSDNDRQAAEQLRLELELQGRAGSEVVLLEADDEQTIRKTHARYFKTASELLRTP